MVKTYIFRVSAVLLAVLVCAAPFYAMRRRGRRLPDNPIPSEIWSVTEPADEERSEDAAETAPDAAEQTLGHAQANGTDAPTPANPTARRATQTPLSVQPQPVAVDTENAGQASVYVYGFTQSGKITSSRTAERQKTASAPAETTTQPSAAAPEAIAQTPVAAAPTLASDPAPDVPAEQTPKLVTDLPQYAVVRQGEAEDDTLRFVAYGTDGDGLSVQVRVREQMAAGSPALLSSTDGRSYAFPMTLGRTYLFYVTLLQDGQAYAAPAVFSVTYRADLADKDHPQVGTGVSLYTNLDHLRDGDSTQSAAMTLKVTARTAPDGLPLYADSIEVKLDGVVLPTVGGSENPEYDLTFRPPNVGQTRSYTIEVLAWHGADSAYWSRTVQYRAAAEGSVVGTAAMSLDATTIGLDVLDEAQIELVQGETAAHAVLRFLEQFGYTATIDGTANVGFYLRAVSRAGICDGAAIPTDLLAMLQHDGVPVKTAPADPDVIAERDFTGGSGWMFAVNGVVYERGLSAMTLHDGDTLSLRFTLAWGKDVGGAPVSGVGKLRSYCGVWVDGAFLSLPHTPQGEPQTDAHGQTVYRCANCGQLFNPITEEDHANDDTAPAVPLVGFVLAAVRLHAKGRVF